MPENTGYYEKFNVSRKDGRDAPGGDREGARYFTLDLTHDQFAGPALRAYVEASRDELPELAAAMESEFPQFFRDDRVQDARLRPVVLALIQAWRDLPDGSSFGSMYEAMAYAAIGAIDTYEWDRTHGR